MGSGTTSRWNSTSLTEFQSTHSVGSGTFGCNILAVVLFISIHPLRGEWDFVLDCFPPAYDISIHPLRGEWDCFCSATCFLVVPFQSTHSVGSGTINTAAINATTTISIHPLRGEWDVRFCEAVSRDEISIHPLRGEWDMLEQCVNDSRAISIHPLRGEWDFISCKNSGVNCYFNPPTPWGVGLFSGGVKHCRQEISIHPLRGEWD